MRARKQKAKAPPKGNQAELEAEATRKLQTNKPTHRHQHNLHRLKRLHRLFCRQELQDISRQLINNNSVSSHPLSSSSNNAQKLLK